jgi:hypothetical protein
VRRGYMRIKILIATLSSSKNVEPPRLSPYCGSESHSLHLVALTCLVLSITAFCLGDIRGVSPTPPSLSVVDTLSSSLEITAPNTTWGGPVSKERQGWIQEGTGQELWIFTPPAWSCGRRGGEKNSISVALLKVCSVLRGGLEFINLSVMCVGSLCGS